MHEDNDREKETLREADYILESYGDWSVCAGSSRATRSSPGCDKFDTTAAPGVAS
jgi:hypothetical protein